MLASIMSCSITSPLMYFSSSEIFSLTSGVNTGDDNTLQKHLNIFPTSSKSYDLIIFPNVYMSEELVVQMRQELKRGGNKLTNGLSDDIIKQLRRLSAHKGNLKITFLEFLNFIVSQKDPNGFQMKDNHFNSANIVCNPCAIRYDIIAKYKTQRLTYNGTKIHTKQLNSTKLSRMTHLGFKEPRIIGVSGGG